LKTLDAVRESYAARQIDATVESFEESIAPVPLGVTAGV
jgi:hypothetical protein